MISSPQSFSAIREIIEEFSLYSGLKINQSKTSNISNSPTLLSSFHSSFSQGKTLTSTKILGITFSFHKEDLSKNWDDLICTLPHTLIATLNPKDFVFSKTISINQHFLPKILFLSRIILPTPKQIKTFCNHQKQRRKLEEINKLKMNKDDFAFYEDQIGSRKRKCFDVVEPIDQSDINFLQKMSQKQSNSNNTVSTSSANIDIVLGFASDTSTSENSEILVSFDSALPCSSKSILQQNRVTLKELAMVCE